MTGLVRNGLIVTAVAVMSAARVNAFQSCNSRARSALVPLFAVPRSRQTARESAVMAEWEQLSELQRRVEDGIHYEHWPEASEQSNNHAAKEPELPTCRGVFCGYRVTDEEYARLKSAAPEDAAPLDDFIV